MRPKAVSYTVPITSWRAIGNKDLLQALTFLGQSHVSHGSQLLGASGLIKNIAEIAGAETLDLRKSLS